MSKAWSFLTLEADARQFRGNTGYEDDLARHYSWDRTVSNYGQPQAGHLAILRDRDFVLGIGWIDDVTNWVGEKDRFRCPKCKRTGFKERSTRLLKYKCSTCKEEFDVPDIEHLTELTFYRADYARTWRALDTPTPVSAIEFAYLSMAGQHSIRELDFDKLRKLVDTTQPPGSPWWGSDSPKSTELPGGHSVVIGKARIGQQRFRQQMLARFGEVCAVAGPLPGEVLDAAHLYRYADRPQHRLDGGLLLRRDLHALFDKNLLLIDPDDGWRVWLAPKLEVFPELWGYNGIEVAVSPTARPNALYLREHAALTRATWDDDPLAH